MNRYALINNGIVENIVLWDGDPNTWTPPVGHDAVLDDGTATLGATYANGVFTPPVYVEPVPSSVSPRQLKLALLQDNLLDQVEAFVNQADRATQISWQYATEFDRNNELLDQMAVAFGMTSDQMDDLFRLAATL